MPRGLLLVAALLGLAGCPPKTEVPDGGSCLDRPDELTRQPNGELPCELLPPGFKR